MEADVIRYREAVWERRGPKKGRAVKVGGIEVTAEVTDEWEEGGDRWLLLLVRGCVVKEDSSNGRKALGPKIGGEIKRARKTVEKWGKPERLPWSDESARARVAAEKRPMKPKTRKPQDEARA